MLLASLKDLRDRDLIHDKDYGRLKQWAGANDDAPDPDMRAFRSLSPVVYRRLVGLVSESVRGL